MGAYIHLYTLTAMAIHNNKNNKRNRKYSVIKTRVIAILQDLGKASLDVIDQGFLNPKYAFTHPSRALLGLPTPQHSYTPDIKRKKVIAVNLSRLEKEGLIVKSGTRKKFVWKTTKQRGQYLSENKKFFRQSTHELPPKDGKVRIFTFDIPERERWKRDRMRLLLVACDFAQLQQSVWVGTRPLAAFLIEEIKAAKITPYIHIFEISKRGTLVSIPYKNQRKPQKK